MQRTIQERKCIYSLQSRKVFIIAFLRIRRGRSAIMATAWLMKKNSLSVLDAQKLYTNTKIDILGYCPNALLPQAESTVSK
jgi:hypothetical protein